MGCDCLDIEVLARVELNAWEENQGCIGGIVVNDLEDLLRAEDGFLGVLGLDEDHGGGGIEVVESNLGFNRILHTQSTYLLSILLWEVEKVHDHLETPSLQV